MDVKSFLNPTMYKKIPSLPPEALKYLLDQIKNTADNDPDKKQLLRVANMAKRVLVGHDQIAKDNLSKELKLKRYFFLPFNKVLFEGNLQQRQVGCISRYSVEKIWTYLYKTLIPDEIEEYEKSFSAAIEKKEIGKARVIVTEFNRLAGQKLEAVINHSIRNDTAWRRFSMAIGSKIIAKDAEELCYYLQNMDEVEQALKLFSKEIADLSGNKLAVITDKINSVKDKNIIMLPFYLNLLISVLKHPEHALRIITKYYRIDDASSASKCDLALIGQILLFKARVNANNFEKSKKTIGNVVQTLENYIAYADIILGIEREFNVSPISSWGKDIIELRQYVSKNLNRNIMSCPKLLKDILGKYQEVKNGVIASPPDQIDIDELNECLYLFYGIKNYIAATSCNAIYTEFYKKTMQFIEILSIAIVDVMRRETPKNQKTMLHYLAISTGLIRIIKGDEQADVYNRGGLLAIRSNNVA